MKILNFVFAAIILLTSCKDDSGAMEQTIGNGTSDTIKGLQVSYLALGDSYTIGQNVTVDQRWPVLLAKDLRARGTVISQPDIIATTGWTTGDLLNSLETSPPKKKYDMVSLLIGVNNQYQGRSLEQYRTEFAKLLVKSIGYTNGEVDKVFVLSIPDWGVTRYGIANKDQISKEIDDFNDVAKEECLKMKILFIDITPISRKALNDPTMVASDQLHFSGKMHQLWVNEVLQHLKS